MNLMRARRVSACRACSAPSQPMETTRSTPTAAYDAGAAPAVATQSADTPVAAHDPGVAPAVAMQSADTPAAAHDPEAAPAMVTRSTGATARGTAAHAPDETVRPAKKSGATHAKQPLSSYSADYKEKMETLLARFELGPDLDEIRTCTDDKQVAVCAYISSGTHRLCIDCLFSV